MQNNKKKSEKNLKSERILRRIVDKALTKNTYILLDVFLWFFFFVTSIQFVAYELRENLSNRSSGVQISHDLYSFWALFVLYEVQLGNKNSNAYTDHS